MFRGVDVEDVVDLDRLEAREIEVEADFNQTLKFATERVILPTGLFSCVAATTLVGSAYAADLPSRRAPPVYVPPVPMFTALFSCILRSHSRTTTSIPFGAT
jgi:hypothetical protein